ncbi:MAG: hypothetical protein IJJ69_12435 [Oscillospiraceae bacterium]|nr:hypothetical protein [Oscillospiraceae bacterium]
MKTYKQMADAVLSARDDYLRKKQRQKMIFYRYAPVMASFSFAVLIGLHIWEDRQSLPKIPDIPEDSAATSEMPKTSETETEPFSETEAVPANPENQVSLEIPAESESIAVPETIFTEIQVSATSETSSVAETHTETRTEAIPEPTEPVPEIISIEEITVPETDAPAPETVIITEPVMTVTVPETEIPPVTELPEESKEQPVSEQETISETSDTEPLPTEDIPVEEIEPSGTAKLFSRIVLHLIQSAPGQDVPVEEDVSFNVTGYLIPEEAVGEWFDTVDVTVSYPDGTSRFIEGVGNAYLVNNMPFGTAAAVQFTGEDVWYLFRNSEISPEDFRNLLADSGIM